MVEALVENQSKRGNDLSEGFIPQINVYYYSMREFEPLKQSAALKSGIVLHTHCICMNPIYLRSLRITSSIIQTSNAIHDAIQILFLLFIPSECDVSFQG